MLQHTVEVLSLLSDDVETDDACPGENLKLRLKGIEEEEILPGFILCSPDNLCHSGRTFDAQVTVLRFLSLYIWLLGRLLFRATTALLFCSKTETRTSTSHPYLLSYSCPLYFNLPPFSSHLLQNYLCFVCRLIWQQ